MQWTARWEHILATGGGEGQQKILAWYRQGKNEWIAGAHCPPFDPANDSQEPDADSVEAMLPGGLTSVPTADAAASPYPRDPRSAPASRPAPAASPFAQAGPNPATWLGPSGSEVSGHTAAGFSGPPPSAASAPPSAFPSAEFGEMARSILTECMREFMANSPQIQAMRDLQRTILEQEDRYARRDEEQA